MIMPFASAFSVHNVGIALDHLPMVYLVTGISTLFVAPAVGRLTDRIGPLPVFYAGSGLTIAMVAVYTRLGPSPLACRRLRVLALSACGLTGPIPPALAECAGLQRLHLHANSLTGCIRAVRG